EAIECYRRAIELAPRHATAHQNLGMAFLDQGTALLDQGELEDSLAVLRKALALAPQPLDAASNFLFALNYDPRLTPQAVFREHRAWGERCASVIPSSQSHRNSPEPGRRLRIGYVSPDFRRHSCAFFIEPLLAAHDPVPVEVFCYAELSVGDEVTA